MGTTVTTRVPKPSAEEKALQQQQLEVAKEQLVAIRQQNEFTQRQFELGKPFFESLAEDQRITREAFTPEERTEQIRETALRQQRLGPIEEELLNLELERIRSGGAATPEQIEQIEAATGAQLGLAESDIDRVTKSGLGLLRSELAPSLGLRSRDTPILDRGGRIAEEGIRLKSQAGRAFRGAAASARLNLPLALSQMNQSQQQITQGISQFQEQLKQRALENRLRLQAAPSGEFGSSLMTRLQRERFAGSTTRQRGFSLSGVGTLAQGVGSMMSS